jgi:hypothetical protein
VRVTLRGRPTVTPKVVVVFVVVCGNDGGDRMFMVIRQWLRALQLCSRIRGQKGNPGRQW